MNKIQLAENVGPDNAVYYMCICLMYLRFPFDLDKDRFIFTSFLYLV